MHTKSQLSIFTVTLLVGSLTILLWSTVWADQTTDLQAQKAVTGWLRANPQPLGTELGGQVASVEIFTSYDDEPLYYVVYLESSGFVIVPADDQVEPIIAFVQKGVYEPSLDNPLAALVINDIQERISEVRNTEAITQGELAARAGKAKMKWDQLIAYSQSCGVLGLTNLDDVRVAPLVQTKWGQFRCCDDPATACYNYYTPRRVSSGVIIWDNGNPSNYYCGCVATAMAQLMRYHQHPTAGIGVHQFDISAGNGPTYDTANTRGGDGLGGPYNWSLMVYQPNCSTTISQSQAIGALCFDASISVNMHYHSSGSTTNTLKAADSFVNLFGYSHAVRGDNGGSDIGAPLIQMVNPNLDAKHPVILGLSYGTSGGHTVVCDGYGFNNLTLYHHLNMGWEGDDDAWYNLPTVDSSPYFNRVRRCVYNIHPSSSGDGEVVSGRVLQQNGDPIAGADVFAEDGMVGHFTQTDIKGIYAFDSLQSNTEYRIWVEKQGCCFPQRYVTTGQSVDDTVTSGNKWAVDFVCTDEFYVDSTATGSNNGASWADAFNYLQDALAAGGCSPTILVAQGTYKPDATSAVPGGSGDRTDTFQLINGVEIYGGFPQGGGTWQQRDPDAYETILSGDIGSPDVNTDNSYHVVTSSGTDASAVLDGFTITAGNANGSNPHCYGGGIYNDSGDCTVANCTFSDNVADSIGGGMYTYWGSPTVLNCRFRENQAYTGGGGMYNGLSCNTTIVNCTFRDNYVSWGWGGGMFNENNSHPLLVNCIFLGNSTASHGGAIYNHINTSPTLINCIFSGNHVPWRGGGLYNWDGCRPTLVNCTLSGNSAGVSGGGMDSVDNSPIIINSIFWGNTAPGGTSQIAGSATVSYSDIQGGYTGAGNIDADPFFIDPDGTDNITGTEDDDLRLGYDSSCIDTGDNSSVPADTLDLDDDNDMVEPIPFDIAEHPRIVDGDCNDTDVVDMGAYEFAWIHIGDFKDNDCDVDFADYAIFALAWLTEEGQPKYNPICDISMPADGFINEKDFKIFTDSWLAGK